MKNVLFITWDGPQTSYMEGLFLPIFCEIQKAKNYRFHVIQFTWGTTERIVMTQNKAEELNIFYTAKKIHRNPSAALGSFFTLFEGINFLKKYIKTHAIDIVMPRSTMPAIMVNRLKKRNYKILFDADGLPIEERIDFSALNKKSFLYNFLKKEEQSMLIKADTVITRTEKSIDFHLKALGNNLSEKFFVVVNGRDVNFFKPNNDQNELVRETLGLKGDTKVFIYSGSLGPQYGWDIMLKIFKGYLEINYNSVLLILTGNTDFAQKRIPAALQNHVIIKSVPFDEIPKFLSIGNIAFAIREPKASMVGVSPIKLGEYLLMEIPTIASAGIGDTEAILLDNPNCFLFRHECSDNIDKALHFIDAVVINPEKLRKTGLQSFSMERSVESYTKALNHCL